MYTIFHHILAQRKMIITSKNKCYVIKPSVKAQILNVVGEAINYFKRLKASDTIEQEKNGIMDV